MSARALRHYEELGLLPARRRANGYRDYDEGDVRVVAEIRSLVGLGFTLEETRPFVECLQAGHSTGAACPAALAVHRRKLAEVDDWIARLHTVRGEIVAQMAPRCEFTRE